MDLTPRLSRKGSSAKFNVGTRRVRLLEGVTDFPLPNPVPQATWSMFGREGCPDTDFDTLAAPEYFRQLAAGGCIGFMGILQSHTAGNAGGVGPSHPWCFVCSNASPLSQKGCKFHFCRIRKQERRVEPMLTAFRGLQHDF